MEDSLGSMFEEWISGINITESQSEDKIQEEFITTHRSRIGLAIVDMSTKIMSDYLAEKSHLAVPKFEGDILEFPEYQRRWKALVPAAGLGAEAELDRLRDNVPDEAKNMLIGQISMDGAWNVLNKMYGNKTMLANKLKLNSRQSDHQVKRIMTLF